jgi:CubicO group peptidase (beta-lactamase class C family)
VDDLYRFARALEGDVLLSAASRQQIFSLQATMEPENPHRGYGYGWIVVEDEDGPPPGLLAGHNGSIDGFSTAIMRYAELDAVVIVLSNVEQRNPSPVAQWLAEQFILP